MALSSALAACGPMSESSEGLEALEVLLRLRVQRDGLVETQQQWLVGFQFARTAAPLQHDQVSVVSATRLTVVQRLYLQ